MKVIAINGSPRKDGNCATVIEPFSEVLEQEGIQCERIDLNPHTLRPCLGCYKCFDKKDGKCIIKKDDFNDIQEKLREAKAVLLLSPVYTASVTALLKAFMERSSLVALANMDKPFPKMGAAVAVARRAGTLSALEPILHYLHVCDMISLGSTYWNIAFGGDKGEVAKDKEGMETLFNLAKKMTWLLKSLEFSREAVPMPKPNRIEITNFIRGDL